MFPTTDRIRFVAVSVLGDFPDGIKQANLWKMVERVLSHEYEINYTRVRNALWDLDKSMSEYVFKVKKSPKNVILYPTTFLIEENRRLKSTINKKEEGDEVEKTDEYTNSGIYLNKVLGDFLRLFADAEKSSFATNLALIRNSIKHLHIREIEALIVLENLNRQASEAKELVSKVYHNLRRERREDSDV